VGPEATDESPTGEAQPDDYLGGEVFSVASRREGARAVIEIDGELDLHAIEPLKAKVREALAAGVEIVELDASGVTYLDSVVLAMFLAFQVNVPKEGAELRFVAVSPEFARIVTLAGLEDTLLPAADAPADTTTDAPAETDTPVGD
jgi:anti-anti-sigma factor